MGDQLSYEDLFKKNKKRVRVDRNSMAENEMSSLVGEDRSNQNSTMNKSLMKSMFNEPMSVRGIKRITLEADATEKDKKLEKQKSSEDDSSK